MLPSWCKTYRATLKMVATLYHSFILHIQMELLADGMSLFVR